MESTYEKLIKAAIKLMIKKSYAGTSVGMLAEKVGISKSTVIHYFKTKEGILLAILDSFFPSAIKELKYIASQTDISGMDKLKKMIKFQMNQVSESGGVLALVIRETRYLNEENKKLYLLRHQEYEGFFVKAIRQAQEEDSELFKNIDPKFVMKAILGMCNYGTIWFKKGGKLSTEEIAEQFFNLITGQIFGTLNVESIESSDSAGC